MIFPTDTLQQKIEITDLKPFLSGENNTSVLIILATTVIIYQLIKWHLKSSTSRNSKETNIAYYIIHIKIHFLIG